MSNTFVTPKVVSTLKQSRIDYNNSITALLDNFASAGQPSASSVSLEGVTGLRTGMLWYKSGSDPSNGEGRMLVYDGSKFTRNGISTYKVDSISQANSAASAGKISYGELVLVGTDDLYMVNTANTGVVSVVPYTSENSTLFNGLSSDQFLRSDQADTATANITFNASAFVSDKLGINTTNPAYTLEVQGDIYASNDVSVASDARLKSNVHSIDKALDLVERLRGVRFIKDGREQIGLIAQEVEPVLPEVVNSQGEYLSITYQNIIAVLIEAIKEQQQQIKELQRET